MYIILYHVMHYFPGWSYVPVHFGTRLLVMSFWSVSVVITATYSGNLVAIMSVHKPAIPVDSLQDLRDNPQYDIGLIRGTALEELFKVGWTHITDIFVT